MQRKEVKQQKQKSQRRHRNSCVTGVVTSPIQMTGDTNTTGVIGGVTTDKDYPNSIEGFSVLKELQALQWDKTEHSEIFSTRKNYT